MSVDPSYAPVDPGIYPAYTPLAKDTTELTAEDTNVSHLSRQPSSLRRLLGGKDVEDDMQRRLCYARTTCGITMRQHGGACVIEESVYGAAIVMPQLARTVGWDRTMTILALRSMTFLILNCCLQSYLLAMLAKEENVMDLFAGQMNLCDFGAYAEVVAGPGGFGPGGTEITTARTYSWAAYAQRTFLRDSLKALLKGTHTGEEIDNVIDPGEYGVESHSCRLVCCFIFVISCMQEFHIMVKMIELLYYVPTLDDPWIEPRADGDCSGSIGDVHIKISGMPMFWKIFNLVTIVGLKLLLWKQTCATGMFFLMETSGIDDAIINSVALTFITNLDEIIYETLMSEEVRNMVGAIEEYPLYTPDMSCVGDMSLLSDEELLRKHDERQNGQSWRFKDFLELIPGGIVYSVVLTMLFLEWYYFRKCERDEDGRWVSKPMYLPTTTSYSIGEAFFPTLFPQGTDEKPFWTYARATKPE